MCYTNKFDFDFDFKLDVKYITSPPEFCVLVKGTVETDGNVNTFKESWSFFCVTSLLTSGLPSYIQLLLVSFLPFHSQDMDFLTLNWKPVGLMKPC